MPSPICPGCGTRREDPSAPCPTCGYAKVPDMKKKVLQFVLLFAILGALWLSFLLKDNILGGGPAAPTANPDTHGRSTE